MKRDSDGHIFAACECSVSEGFEVSLNQVGGAFFVDMWKPDGDNHWTMQFATAGEAVREYNKWVKVPEEVPSA